jgi:hypothetical protein
MYASVEMDLHSYEGARPHRTVPLNPEVLFFAAIAVFR